VEQAVRFSGTDGLALVISVAVCFAAAAAGSWLTFASLDTWYAGLAKPSLNPPNWVFGPVWSTLYLLMAIAAWLIWQQRARTRIRLPLSLFAAQLAVNVAWSGCFFYLERLGLAFGDVVLLWLLILATMVSFFRVSRAAGALLVPYLLWVSFASYLNFAIWRLNA
jgi:tryptophan-rich sensory protein